MYPVRADARAGGEMKHENLFEYSAWNIDDAGRVNKFPEYY
jgi:hypothetical protein